MEEKNESNWLTWSTLGRQKVAMQSMQAMETKPPAQTFPSDLAAVL